MYILLLVSAMTYIYLDNVNHTAIVIVSTEHCHVHREKNLAIHRGYSDIINRGPLYFDKELVFAWQNSYA